MSTELDAKAPSEVERVVRMQRDSLTPKVSVGLPVYNGERYLAQTIESILAQTYSNLELIISDNASTDATEEICRSYAALDKRVQYYRNDSNRGAVANFNGVFEPASGEYFKWAAHDDMIEPEFAERCVRALNDNPDASLCHARVKRIDEKGDVFGVAHSDLVDADSNSVSARFAVLIFRVRTCREIFGLIRVTALRRTSLHQSYEGEDKALLAELALLGQFVELPEALFLHRDHHDRFVRRTRVLRAGYVELDADKCLTWYDPDKAGQRMMCTWLLLLAYHRMIPRHVASHWERLCCYGHLVRWICSGWRWARLALEPLNALDPRLFHAIRRFTRLVHRHNAAPKPRARADYAARMK